MATWAMKQRYAWIEERLANGESFTRADIAAKFYVTTQTASATVAEFKALHPGSLRYDGSRKAFVRNDAPPMPRGLTARERLLLTALKTLHHKTVIGTDDERHAALNGAWAAIHQVESA